MHVENHAGLNGKGTDGPLISVASGDFTPMQARRLAARLIHLADEGEQAMPVIEDMMNIMDQDGESMETMAIALFRAGYRKQA